MILAKVIGQVVSTAKHPDYIGYALLVIQPIDPTGHPTGKSFIALGAAQAGIGDTVLALDEGGSGRAILNAPDKRTLRTVVAAIVDEITTVNIETGESL